MANSTHYSELFGVKTPIISKHLKNIYESKELSLEATVSKMEMVQVEGERQVTRVVDVYNLDATIAVGYRVNSNKTTTYHEFPSLNLLFWLTGHL